MRKTTQLIVMVMLAAYSAMASAAGVAIDTCAVFTWSQAERLGLVKASRAPRQAPAARAASEDTTKGYGFVDNVGLTSFRLENPTTTRATIVPTDKYIMAATRVGNSYYIVEYDYLDRSGIPTITNWTRLDLATGKFSKVASFSGDARVIMDLTYDYHSQQMWGITAETNSWKSHLVKVDMRTAKITVVADYDVRYFGIAADTEGNLFGIDRAGDLVTFDRETGRASYIGNTGVRGYVINSMDFDHRSHTLYYTNTQENGCTLYSINTSNAHATSKGLIGMGSNSKEVIGLSVELHLPNGKTPAGVDSLKAVAGENGQLKATVSWINPTTTFDATPLTALSKIELYVSGKLYKTFDNPVPGERVSTEISELANGNIPFRVRAYNDEGAGDLREAYAWVGIDLPKAPRNIAVAKQPGTRAVLKWDVPQGGQHDGYLDPATVRYAITRYAINNGTSEVLARAYRGTTFEDTTINTVDRYYYTIQSLSNDFGQTATSDSVVLGPGFTPTYFCNFNSDEKFNLWTVVDGNHNGSTWERYLKGGYIQIYAGYVRSDDWAISPPLQLKADSTYFNFFDLYVYDQPWVRTKRLQVTLGTSPDPASHTTVLKDITFTKLYTERQGILFKVPADGEYYIGLHDMSDSVTRSLHLANFGVDVNHTATIRGRITDADDGTPIDSVDISFRHAVYRIMDYTDADGNFTLPYLRDEGSFQMVATKFGYFDSEGTITITKDAQLTYNATLKKRPPLNVKGRVVGDDGAPVKGAMVKIEGYSGKLTAITDADGNYSFNGIYGDTYTAIVEKIKFMQARDTMAISTDSTFNFTLRHKVLAPHDMGAYADASRQVNLTWKEPYEIYRRDDGFYSAQGGYQSGTVNTVSGSIYYQPGRIRAIAWVTTNLNGPHNTMNLWLFDLDENGMPTKPLYSVRDVPTRGDFIWNSYTLPQPVDCPNGFLVGVSYTNGMSSLALDGGHPGEWAYTPGTALQVGDYTKENWQVYDSKFNTKSFLIRALGEDIDPEPQQYGYKYNVYRFAEGDRDDESKWTLLTPQPIADYNFIDDVKSLPDGDYYYAVKATYPADTLSTASYSAKVTVKGGMASGIDEVDIAAGVQVYPNPATTVIKVSQPFERAELYDMNGRIARAVANDSEIDVQQLAAGMYALRLRIDGRTIMRKVLVKH